MNRRPEVAGALVRSTWRSMPSCRTWITPLLLILGFALHASAQQPAEPVDHSPLNGEMYYLINQSDGLQMDLNSNSTTVGDHILQNTRSFTDLSQRFAFTKMPSGNWKISNILNGLCLDSSLVTGVTWTVQNPCGINVATQEWTLSYVNNGYETIQNSGTGYVLDVFNASTSAGAWLDQSTLSASPTQSQQWLLRPVFFRGTDNSIQEKAEAERVAGNYPFWQDAGTYQDALQIMKNHGFNMVRIRPTSIPPYSTYTLTSSTVTPATCSSNGCYAETDAADLDLAKRAKALGMSVELTLFFDGGSSNTEPGVWSSAHVTLAQLEADLYTYVKAEVEMYRSAGVMPDLVAIGNEVDTGLFGTSLKTSPSGAANSTNFLNFSAVQKQGMQAILDASSDTSIGPAIPAPLRCIHITPAWDLTSFFGEVNTDGVPYDIMCQSYYPIYHGPLTAAQAAESNPSNQPIEQTALTNAANSIAKPVFLIEVGEHYENGFDANDPWYPPTTAGQRQYVLDVDSVVQGLPNNLAMGIEWWDPTGTNIPAAGGGITNGDGKTNAIYSWNGLTLFDNADGGTNNTVVTAPNYNAVLPAMTAVGGRLDASLNYKLVNQATAGILESALALTAPGSSLNTAAENGVVSLHQQWGFTSNGDGYFQIGNKNSGNVLDDNGSGASGTPVVQNVLATGTPITEQEWDVITAGNGYYTIVNRSSGLILGVDSNSGVVEQQTPTATNTDWIVPANQYQAWQIVPVHISVNSTASQLAFAAGTPTSLSVGATLSSINVNVENTANAIIGTPAETVGLSVTGPGGYSQTGSAGSSNGVANFNITAPLNTAGTYTLSATSGGLGTAVASIILNTPGIYTPAANSSLTGSSATFQWYGATGATAYWIDVGSSPGSNTYYQSGSLPVTTLSATVNGLPINGSTIYVTLYWLTGGSWTPNAYTFTAFNSGAASGILTTPTPSSALTGSGVTFGWTAGSGATAYWIDAGSTAGGNQYFQSGNLGNVLSYAGSGLPTNGTTVYVTLYSMVNGQWLSNAYTYTAYNLASAGGVMQTPNPGSTLTSGTVTFTWSAGSGASGYWLDVGNTSGGNQYLQSGNLGNVLTTTVNGLPTDGSTIYATLYSLIGTTWTGNAYSFTALNATGGLAVMQTPGPGSTIAGNQATFTWSADANAMAYWVDISAVAAGGNDVYQSGNLGNVTNVTVNSLPANGSTIYVTLYSYVGGQWLSTASTYTSAP